MTKHARITKHLPLAALALAISAAAGSAVAATATATSTSTVITPIAISKTADLSFGSFAASAAGGTVTVSPNGNRAVTGVTAMGGTATAAQFDVTGLAGATYSITFGGSTELSDGTNTMAFAPISDLSASAITSGNVSTGTLTAGAQSIYVGGILTVGASQAAGTYTGTVTATVEYN